MKTVLVCSLGGSPQPLTVSIENLRPDHIVFAASSLSSMQIPEILDALTFVPTHDTVIFGDEQDMRGCLQTMTNYAAKQDSWKPIAAEGGLYVDFTGGTKAMVAAMALAFADLPVVFRYVGGTNRTKEGLGVIQSGTEIIVSQKNPRTLVQ